MQSPRHLDEFRNRRSGNADAEAGFMLVFVVLLMALVLIALAVAAPVVAKDLRRDKEVESAHRAEQYVRAIRLYYRKTHTYPPSIAALENTNNVRFLRKQYVDPLTGKNDWRLIHVGENKTTVKGFFGQPLGGLNGTGAGGLGSASSMTSGMGGTSSPTAGTTSTIGSTSGLAGGFLGASTTTGGNAGTTGAAGTGSGTGTASDSTNPLSGGLGQIMGVGTSKTGTSILTPNAQATYQTWEFLYDPRIEQLYAQSSILGGGISSQPASGFGSNGATGQPNSTNSMSGSSMNSPFGSNGSTNSTNTTGTTGSTTTPPASTGSTPQP
jgi:type II secretory pathway pseudopilin PulG